MTDRPSFAESETCPKTVWVLSTLSDDELCDGGAEIPAGLAFHLNRCPSCRALADRLRTVTLGLHALSRSEPDDGLEDQAEKQLQQALAHGAVFTGRVQIPEDEFEMPAPTGSLVRTWFHWSNLAAAAVLVLTIGGLYLSYRQSRIADPPIVQQLHPVPTDRDFELVESTSLTAPRSDQKPLADAVKSGKRTSALRRHQSHLEAALADDEGAVQYGVILPDPASRGVYLGSWSWFDKPVENGSTMTFQKDN